VLAGNGLGYDFVAAPAATPLWQVALKRSCLEIGSRICFNFSEGRKSSFC